jgi:hypothetical protein
MRERGILALAMVALSGAFAAAPPLRMVARRAYQPACRALGCANAASSAPPPSGPPARPQLVLGALGDQSADRIEWDEHKRRWRRMGASAPATTRLRGAWQFIARPAARLLLMGRDTVTPEYYRFTYWRMLQRLLSAIKDVFATQALLGALGVRADGARNGAAAAGAWIGKESLGRFSKIAWSGKMKKLMDADAKRVRFRTALLYPLGQALELMCRWQPQLFLVLGTAGIFCKQISLMTASATRSAFYRSFSADRAAGAIGEMTATGEAQVSVASAIGIAIGIISSERLLSHHPALFPPLFLLLCALDVSATYQEVRAVVCERLNHERTRIVLAAWMRERRVPSPREVAEREHILRSSGVACAFASPAQLRLPPSELEAILAPWDGEVFALVPGWACARTSLAPSRAAPRIVLSAWARCAQASVLRAWLAHSHACELLASVAEGDVVRATEAMRAARVRTDQELPMLREALAAAGWQLKSFAYMPIGADDRASWDLTATVAASAKTSSESRTVDQVDEVVATNDVATAAPLSSPVTAP